MSEVPSFLYAIIPAAGIAMITLANWQRRTIIGVLALIALASWVMGHWWEDISAHYPAYAQFITLIATSRLAWFMLGSVTTVSIYGAAAKFRRRRLNKAELRLILSDVNESLREDNSKKRIHIWAWRCSKIRHNTETIDCEIYIGFEHPGISGNLKVHHIQRTQPTLLIKEQNERFAVIVLTGIHIGTLNISVSNEP